MPFLTIAFPVFDPIAISIGPVAIRWYALAYIGGIVLGWIYARSLVKNERLWGGPAPITLPQLDDFILWVTIGIIVGGRTGYVLFYNLPFFVAHPSEILELWKGGMSFHGGFLGCVAAVVLFALKRGLSILSLGDVTCAVGTIGVFLGRLANFINGELWGRPADPSLPWAMVFPQSGLDIARHPSQLYQFLLEGLLLLALLWWYARRPAAYVGTRGQAVWGKVSGAFLLGYGLLRFAAEYFREPDGFLGLLALGLSMGQWLCVPMILGGAAIWTWASRRDAVRQPV